MFKNFSSTVHAVTFFTIGNSKHDFLMMPFPAQLKVVNPEKLLFQHREFLSATFAIKIYAHGPNWLKENIFLNYNSHLSPF